MKGLILVLALVAADHPQQFDLSCTFSGRQPKGTPTGDRYRIDLAAGLWCQGICTDVAKIVDVTPTKLTLKDLKADYRDGPSHHIEIDRVTGALWDDFQVNSHDTIPATQGVCEVAPFSGFPARTKF